MGPRSAPSAPASPLRTPIGKLTEQGRSLVDPNGGLSWARPAITDDRPMPQGPSKLARGGMQSMQDESEPAARRYPPSARYADKKA